MKAQLAILLAWAITVPIVAQEQKPTAAKEPKTKIEAFEAKTGAVIMVSHSNIGTINGKSLRERASGTSGGESHTSVSVECREITDARSMTKAYGIWITVTVEYDPEYAYIDYDEIDSLVNGIDYITKIDKGFTKLDQFHADYTTRCGFTVEVSDEVDGKMLATLRSSSNSNAFACFSLEDLTQFKKLMQEAKAKLDSIRPDNETKH